MLATAPDREPHTGIIYTPPLFSDHVAVSLLLSDASLTKPLINGKACTDSLSLQAMPYKRQKRIQDMFAAPAQPKSRAVTVAPADDGANLVEPGGAVAAAVVVPLSVASAVAPKRQASTNDDSDRQVLHTAAGAARVIDHPPTKRRKPGQQGIASFFGPKH